MTYLYFILNKEGSSLSLFWMKFRGVREEQSHITSKKI